MATVPSVKLTVKHQDNSQVGTSKRNTEIFTANPNVINSNMSSDTAVTLDTWARAFVALSTDTYEDTEVSSSFSLTAYISE